MEPPRTLEVEDTPVARGQLRPGSGVTIAPVAGAGDTAVARPAMTGPRRRSRIRSLVHPLRLSGGCDTFGDFAVSTIAEPGRQAPDAQRPAPVPMAGRHRADVAA
jgi:hypothetical protein